MERGYSTGKGEQSIAQQLSQESYTLIVLAPSDLLLAENGKETVDNNGKWNVLFQAVVVGVFNGVEPFGGLVAGGGDWGGEMLKPTVALGTMPMLHAFGDLYHHAGLKGYGVFAPLLIPAAATDADEYLTKTMVNMPVVAASGLECNVGERHSGLLSLAKVGRMYGRKKTLTYEILGIGGVRLALWPRACGGIGSETLLRETAFNKIEAEFGNCISTDAKIDGTTPVGFQLRLGTTNTHQCADGYNLTVGRRENSAGKNVSKKVGFEVVVGLGAEHEIEWLTCETGLEVGTCLH